MRENTGCTRMNARQKQVCSSWRLYLRAFVKREWMSVFLSSAFGILVAELVHLILLDSPFQFYVASKYEHSLSFADVKHYVPYLLITLGALFLGLAPFGCAYVWRGLKSWWVGVTSGLVVMPFATAFLFSTLSAPRLRCRFALACVADAVWFSAGFLLHMEARIHGERTVREDEFRVPLRIKSLSGSQLAESDDPIQSWAQDTLRRAALVDSLSAKTMIAKAPVILLSGPFGSGKTSTLNLLREHLGNKAITISFSTWLPGSEETLTSYLLADIANECQKQYVVPGLRQSARRLATALGQRVPLLNEYLKLLPANTQKDDIEKLNAALIRLPKRVVVLLDELDRMEKEEVLTLLKIIRGISTLPNLSFICAGDRQTIVETVKGTYSEKNIAYFDKFFPVIIQVPELDPKALRKAGTERLVRSLADRDWFQNDSDKQKFRERIEKLWDGRVAPWCHNLRTIGLLANDVSVAAASLRREVDPVDLTLIEMLRRFEPVAYELVARNSLALTGGEGTWRGGAFQTGEAQAKNIEQLLADLKDAFPRRDVFEEVKAVLCELFPVLSKADKSLGRPRAKSQDPEDASNKRISEPAIFPAYFRYELPEAIFSSVEMASFLRQFEGAQPQASRDSVFLNMLKSMEKGSLKRDDFLRKLADSAESIPTPIATSFGESAVKAAAEYTYDLMPSFGEAGHVLRIILTVAKRLSQTERVAFLQGSILNASDDTMALRILTVLTKQKNDSNIGVSVGELYASFTARMRKRYGRAVDAATLDMSTSDSWAFEYWGRDLSASGILADPEDRKIQYDFWIRYIGNSRARLARAFRDFILPIAVYEQDTHIFRPKQNLCGRPKKTLQRSPGRSQFDEPGP